MFESDRQLIYLNKNQGIESPDLSILTNNKIVQPENSDLLPPPAVIKFLIITMRLAHIAVITMFFFSGIT